MQTPISSTHWADALDPRIKIGVQTAAGKVPDEKGMWFTPHDSSLETENILTYGDMGPLEQFQGNVSFDIMKQEYKKSVTNVQYAKGMSVEKKLVLTKQLPVVDQMAENFGRSAKLKFLSACYDWFNLATSTYTTGDTLAIASASHTSNDSRGPATQSNTGTTELSYASFDAAYVAMQKYLSPTSQMDFELKPDCLVVPIDLEAYASEIIGSKGKPDAVTNNINAYNGKVSVVAARPITDTNNWALVNKRRQKLAQHWYTVQALMYLKDQDISTLVTRRVLYTFFGYGSADWRWLYYSNVA